MKRDGLLARSSISAELKTSKEMVDDAIGQLLRMGYLAEDKTSEGCADFCSTCPFAKNCQKEIVKTFKITGKGLSYLEKQQA